MSTKNSAPNFAQNVIKTIYFLEEQKIDYFLLGGLAVASLGEPRFTFDLDLDVFLSKNEVPSFLEKAKKVHFRFKKKGVLETVETFGTFRCFFQSLQVDFILASTELEKSALKRRKKMPLFGKKVWFPSPEDLLLLKIIPGRAKDLMDAESIVLRQGRNLDTAYLKNWVQKISDEAENYRVLHTLQKLLKL